MIKIFYQEKEALATQNAVQEPQQGPRRPRAGMQSLWPRTLLTESAFEEALADCVHVGDLLFQSGTMTKCDL